MGRGYTQIRQIFAERAMMEFPRRGIDICSKDVNLNSFYPVSGI